jgi:carboxypeptidase T
MSCSRVILSALIVIFSSISFARNPSDPIYFVKAMAANKQQRSVIANSGIAIDGVLSDSVTFVGTQRDIDKLKKLGISYEITPVPSRHDFPGDDSVYHNYDRTLADMANLVTKFPNLVTQFTIGKSLQGMDLIGVRISSNPTPDSLPTAIFLGCHHAREHLSVEIPLMLADYLVNQYASDANVKSLLDTREVWIVPMLNPDGAEYDIASGQYQFWRKNRRDNGDGTFGVDLNRNYGTTFGGPGSSDDTNDDTYHGVSAFSEPETAAVRDFVNARTKATMLLTYHTYSELVLWPWSGTNDDISNTQDLAVFQTMGKQMATWNQYTAEKASDLYLAAGDTTDWAYDTHKIFAFTFEMTPNSLSGENGFYPGPTVIQPTFDANLQPALYMIDKSGNPYSVLSERVDPLNMVD